MRFIPIFCHDNQVNVGKHTKSLWVMQKRFLTNFVACWIKFMEFNLCYQAPVPPLH